MSQTAYRVNAAHMEKLLVLMDDLLRRVPVWELCCTKDDEAAYLSRAAMLRGEPSCHPERSLSS